MNEFLNFLLETYPEKLETGDSLLNYREGDFYAFPASAFLEPVFTGVSPRSAGRIIGKHCDIFRTFLTAKQRISASEYSFLFAHFPAFGNTPNHQRPVKAPDSKSNPPTIQ
jgi:hypothetical protein